MGVCVLRSRVRGCRVSVTSQYNGPNTDVSLLGVTRPLREDSGISQNDHARLEARRPTDARARREERKKEKEKIEETERVATPTEGANER